MTAINDGVSRAGTIGGAFAVATRNAGRGGDLAIASGQVVARRMALGIAATFDPLRADHVEFSRMVPEKMAAFSAAGMIMLKRSDRATRQMTRFASDEVATTARATIAMAGCTSPAALAVAQGRFARAWLDRTVSNCIAMGMLALRAQDAVVAPLRQAATANADRLGR